MSIDVPLALAALLDEPLAPADLNDLAVRRAMPVGTVPLCRVDGGPVSIVVPPADGASRLAALTAALEVAARRHSPLVVLDPHPAGTERSGVPLPLAVRPGGAGRWVPVVAVGVDPWAVAGADLGVLIGTGGPFARRTASVPEAAALARRFLAGLRPGLVAPVEPVVRTPLTELVPFETGAAYAMAPVLDAIVDAPGLLALDDDAGLGIRTGTARLGGRAVGVLAADPATEAGRLGVAACRAIVRLAELCTAAHLPLLSFVDSAGLRAEPIGDELLRTLRTMWAAPMPKVVVVTGRAEGAAAALLGAVGVRADFVAAWPRARFAGPEADPGPDGSDGPGGRDAASVWAAALDGALLDVIAPAETRRRLVEVLDVYRGAERFDHG